MAKKFILELIDVPYLAKPSLTAIDVEATAERILRYRSGRSNKSYDANMRQIADMATGRASLDLLLAEFDSVDDQSWRTNTKDVCERLFSVFGRRESRWYAADRKPRELFDRILFKHAIRGVWVKDGKATATLINARKSLFLDASARSFLARGIEEFYLLDDPNLHDFTIIDLGAVPRTDDRVTRVYAPEHIETMGLEEFEAVLKKFMSAVERAGFSSRPAIGESIADLFRRKP